MTHGTVVIPRAFMNKETRQPTRERVSSDVVKHRTRLCGQRDAGEGSALFWNSCSDVKRVCSVAG